MYKSRRQALGQHFLANEGVLRKIVAAIDPRPGDVVVEIGPGKGVLTAALADKAGRVIAVEKDERLIPGLREAMPANVEIVPGDILRTDLRGILEKAGVPALRLVGNIPYSISSPLLFRVLDERASSFGLRLPAPEGSGRARHGRAGHEELRPARDPAPERIRGPRRFHGGAGIVLAPAQGPVGPADAPPATGSPPPRRGRRAVPGFPQGRLRRAAQDALEEPGPPRDSGRARGRLCRRSASPGTRGPRSCLRKRSSFSFKR